VARPGRRPDLEAVRGAYGKPNWFWSITYSCPVKPARGSGVATDLEDGKAGFKAAWAQLRARLTDQEIDAFCRRETATEIRLTRRPHSA